MVHATSNRAIQTTTVANTDDKIIHCQINNSCSNNNDSVLSILSSDYGEGITEVEHPDHFTTSKQDTALTVSDSQILSEIEEIPDHHDTIKHSEGTINNDELAIITIFILVIGSIVN